MEYWRRRKVDSSSELAKKAKFQIPDQNSGQLLIDNPALYTMMNNTKTLKLDSSFRPIEVIDAIEALVLAIGKAQTIETYNDVINSVNQSLNYHVL